MKGADTIQKLVSEPEVLVTTVLIGNNLVNIAASALATSIAIEYFGELGVGIAIGVMTFLILTFGEIVPKTLAMHHAERISLAVSKPLELMIYVIRPVARVFAVVSQVIGRFFGLKAEGKGRLSEEEVQSLLDTGEEDGAIEEDEKEMMNGVLKLDYITVKNVMTPREEIVTNAAGKTTGLICLEDLLEEIVGSIYDEYDVRKKPLRQNTEPERQDQRAV